MSQEDIKREISAEDQYNYSDELFYTGPGDLLDTAEGRAKFCRINETTVFRKTTTSGSLTTRASA